MKRRLGFSCVLVGMSALAGALDNVDVLQERFLKERRPADKKAWYAACERAGVDVTKRKRSAVDARGIYKLNRESRLACISLGKDAAPTGNWTEPLGADGELHVEWTRKPNGGIDCRHTAPTNWDVFVTAWPGPVTRYGFTVLKEKTGTHPLPKILLPPGWRVVWDEKHSDVNVREAYVLVETDATNAPAPKVTFEWPEAGVRRVLGPTKGHAPRNMTTSFPREGSLGFSVTHHIRGTQAGPHRRAPYPEREIASGFNFLFALRDGFRLLGFGRDGALKGGTVILAGFDSHYPNGHIDFPAHFHIMNNCRDGNQVSHFYMDPESGRLTEDCFQDMNRPADCWDRVYRHRPGDRWEMYDGFADVAYTVTMLKDGTGLEIATTNGAFRVSGERPCERVRLSVREGSAWRFVKTLAVRDDPVRGEMVTPDGVIRYDPDTFVFRELRPASGQESRPHPTTR